MSPYSQPLGKTWFITLVLDLFSFRPACNSLLSFPAQTPAFGVLPTRKLFFMSFSFPFSSCNFFLFMVSSFTLQLHPAVSQFKKPYHCQAHYFVCHPTCKYPTCPGSYFLIASSLLLALKCSKHLVTPGSQQISGCQSLVREALCAVSRLILICVMWGCIYSSTENNYICIKTRHHLLLLQKQCPSSTLHHCDGFEYVENGERMQCEIWSGDCECLRATDADLKPYLHGYQE